MRSYTAFNWCLQKGVISEASSSFCLQQPWVSWPLLRYTKLPTTNLGYTKAVCHLKIMPGRVKDFLLPQYWPFLPVFIWKASACKGSTWDLVAIQRAKQVPAFCEKHLAWHRSAKPYICKDHVSILISRNSHKSRFSLVSSTVPVPIFST